LETDEVRLRVGATHLVTLGGLASAGYMWSEAIEGPDGVVSLVQMQADGPPPISPPLGGPSPGTSSRDLSYRIMALKPGTVRVLFALRRPWETGKAPLREIIIDVTVSE
jgi:predicted secreted protein